MITLRWRTHPERVESIKSMSKSEISRRRLKVHTSPVTSDDEKMNDDVENEKLEIAQPPRLKEILILRHLQRMELMTLEPC